MVHLDLLRDGCIYSERSREPKRNSKPVRPQVLRKAVWAMAPGKSSSTQDSLKLSVDALRREP